MEGKYATFKHHNDELKNSSGITCLAMSSPKFDTMFQKCSQNGNTLIIMINGDWPVLSGLDLNIQSELYLIEPSAAWEVYKIEEELITNKLASNHYRKIFLATKTGKEGKSSWKSPQSNCP